MHYEFFFLLIQWLRGINKLNYNKDLDYAFRLIRRDLGLPGDFRNSVLTKYRADLGRLD